MNAASAGSTAPAQRSRSCCAVLRRGLLVLLVLITAIGFAAWFERVRLLRAAADLWVVSDRLAPADAVAILGGGVEVRPFAAAAYYRQGLVKRVLISNIGATPAAKLGAIESHAEANRSVLRKLGVPDQDIELFGANPANTYQEAVALREWALREGIHSLIVPTEIFTTRRVRWVLDQVFAGGMIIEVAALEPYGYRQDDWWQHEGGVIAFQNEVVKYIYYRFKY
jgi:uncharacterized SAM-binding protein YcdF (DUF218 family)